MYEIRVTEECGKRLMKIFKENRSTKRMIENRFEDLKNDPYAGSYHLEGGGFRGKRSLHTGKIRIIFAICEECRKLNHTSFNGCYDCESISDHTIIIFMVDFHEKAYSRKK